MSATPAERLPNGNLRVPMRAEGEGGLVGDGVAEIDSTHPSYAAWDEWLTNQQADQEAEAAERGNSPE